MDHYNRTLHFNGTDWDTDFIFQHDFAVEPAPLDKETVERWIFDKIMLVETYVAMKAFVVNGEVIYYPQHVDGDPYEIVDRRKEPNG